MEENRGEEERGVGEEEGGRGRKGGREEGRKGGAPPSSWVRPSCAVLVSAGDGRTVPVISAGHITAGFH